MNIDLFLVRLKKVLSVLRSRRLLSALVAHRVLAAMDHRAALNRSLNTVVDIGANRGQFALACRACLPKASLVCFEPLPAPANILKRVFQGDALTALHVAAIGPIQECRAMNVSARDDSSSLLPISEKQSEIFPGTAPVGITTVNVSPLTAFLSETDLRAPAMLKLDVQGFELEALRGCEALLGCFDWVYVECSFMELYSGQGMAHEVIEWLRTRGFVLSGVFNPSYDEYGQAIQADFLFSASLVR